MDAIRFMGEIVFTDYGDGCINRADNTTIAEGFSMPSGLAVVGNDLYATDWVTGEGERTTHLPSSRFLLHIPE